MDLDGVAAYPALHHVTPDDAVDIVRVALRHGPNQFRTFTQDNRLADSVWDALVKAGWYLAFHHDALHEISRIDPRRCRLVLAGDTGTPYEHVSFDASRPVLVQLCRAYARHARTKLRQMGTVTAAAVIIPHSAIADFVIDHTVVEIKTGLDVLDNVDQVINQVVAYALADEDDSYQLTEVAIYLARHGVFYRRHLTELVAELTGDDDTSLAKHRAAFARLVAGRRPRMP